MKHRQIDGRDYILCTGCGKRIYEEQLALNDDGEWYCEECGKERLWLDYNERLDADAIAEYREDQEENEYREHCDECFEAERNRDNGIDL